MSAPDSEDLLVSRRHVSMDDVKYVEALTLACRVKDHRDGGGSCLDTVLAHVAWSHTLVRAEVPAVLADRLYTAVADLHNVAGWICFDAGLVPEALRFLTQASQWAQRGRNPALAANISYRLGRIWLHHNAPDRALTAFQLGQIHAHTAASPLAESILSINQAWAYARLGAEEPALALVNQATDHFERADTASAPPWAAFFTANDLQATSGVVHTELARTIDIRYTRHSIPALTTAIAGYGPDMTRSKAFCMIALAIGHLLHDDLIQAVADGHDAVDLCRTLTSARAIDRLRPLKNEADRRRTHPAARALSHEIAILLADNSTVVPLR